MAKEFLVLQLFERQGRLGNLHRICSTHLKNSIYSNNYAACPMKFKSMLRLQMLLFFYYLVNGLELAYITGFMFCSCHV